MREGSLKKKREILGSPPFGAHPSGPHPLGPCNTPDPEIDRPKLDFRKTGRPKPLKAPPLKKKRKKEQKKKETKQARRGPPRTGADPRTQEPEDPSQVSPGEGRERERVRTQLFASMHMGLPCSETYEHATKSICDVCSMNSNEISNVKSDIAVCSIVFLCNIRRDVVVFSLLFQSDQSINTVECTVERQTSLEENRLHPSGCIT